MTAIEDLLAKVKPATSSVRVCLRGDLLGELDLVNEDLAPYDDWEASSLSDVDPRPPLAARKRDIEKRMRQEQATFTFQGIGDKSWSDLLAAHPPRKGHEETENFDPGSYPVALVSAASVDPKMTVEQATQLFNSFTLTQRNIVFAAAYSANVRGVDIPFSPPASAGTAGPAKK